MQSKDNAKKLRYKSTPEEQLLWKHLQDRRLGGYKFRRQMTIDQLIVDFCCLEKRLVIELDGHPHRDSKLVDQARDNYLESQGFSVIRIWNSEIRKNIYRVLDKIMSTLESPSSGAIAPPSPVKGEGKNENLYALVIIAHPDDEAFLMAGTCMRLAEEGKTVGVICATRGEKGADRLNRDLPGQQLGEIRVQELQTACDMINCHCFPCLGYPDGELDRIDFDKLVQDLAGKIEEHAPKIILTFGQEGISGHRDHISIGQAAIAAAKKSTHKVSELWLASMPESIMDQFNEHLNQRKVHHSHFKKEKLQGVPDEQLLKIDIRKYAVKKVQALKAHESQYLPHLTFDLFLENECFEVIRP